MSLRAMARNLDWGKVAVVAFIALCFSAIIFLPVQSHDSSSCYKSTMGNPEEVVMIDDAPFACTNTMAGYRCQKMVPCH